MNSATAATARHAAAQYLANGSPLSRFMPISQRFALKELLKGEEGDHFSATVIALHRRIRDMPKTYDTEKIATNDKILHLHYFGGSVDAWIVEKDAGDGSDDLAQHQAYGKCSLFADGFKDAEWGYISIQELIDNGIELDLYWEPTAVKDVK